MPCGAFRIINQHCANWRLIWIGHREFLEPVLIDELLTSLFRQGRLRSGLHHARGHEGFFYVAPALRKRMCTSAFLCNSRSSAQLRINRRVPSKGLHNFFRIIFVHDLNRLVFARGILQNNCECQPRSACRCHQETRPLPAPSGQTGAYWSIRGCSGQDELHAREPTPDFPEAG